MIRTVAVKLIGGLGNQMFQYAAGLGLARNTGAELLLDISNFENPYNRVYQLDVLSIPQNFFKRYLLLKIARKFIISRKGLLGIKLLKTAFYIEPHFHFDPQFFDIDKIPHVILEGYFQSPEYFNHVGDELRKNLRAKNELSDMGKHFLGKIRATPHSISLHVRRGDYVSHENTALFHGAMDRSYYMRAISALESRLGTQGNYFLFSDDHEYLRQTFTHLPSATIVKTDGDKAHEEIHLMAACQHNIIANSTFSWWGAWLNTKPNRVVIAPSNWFRDTSMNPKDIYMSDWLIL